MNRYFKIVEIDEDTFENVTGEGLNGCSQFVSPESDGVYVAVDDDEEYEIDVDLDSFDYCGG